MNQERQHQTRINDKYKTIILFGRSGDGKNPFTAHLGGQPTCCSELSCVPSCATSCATPDARLYISERCELNIIDTKGLDSSKIDHQELMEEIYKKTISYVDSAIDAIIIMWSPLNNGHLVLLKTIRCLQESFGKDVINSCIFMTQGNWESVAKLGDLDKAKITDQIKEIEREFSHVPQGKYETKLLVHELKNQLEDMMKKIQPYKVKPFKEQHSEKIAEMDPETSSKEEEKQEEERQEEEKQEEEREEVETMQPIVQEERKEEENKENEEGNEEEREEVEAIQPIVQEERKEEENKENEGGNEEVETIEPIIQEERRISVPQNIRRMIKVGSLLTGSGAVTGMAAIAFEQSIFLAAGTIGVTAGAALLTAAAATGVFNGLSWAVQRARGIRA